MNCKFRVGYNHMYLLMDLYKTECDRLNKLEEEGEYDESEYKRPTNPLKPLLFMHINKYCTEKIYGKEGVKNTYKYRNIKKFHYPLQFTVGEFAIGLYEVLFNQKSPYLYLGLKSKDYPDEK